MEPRIERKSFLIAGINKFAKWDDDFEKIVERTQEEFETRLCEVKNIIASEARIKYFYSETGSEEGFDYLECVEITDPSKLPQGFTCKDLKMSEYAVFIEKNGKEGTVAQYARNTWLPQSQYEETFTICGDLEIHNPSDRINHEIWIPIVEK